MAAVLLIFKKRTISPSMGAHLKANKFYFNVLLL